MGTAVVDTADDLSSVSPDAVPVEPPHPVVVYRHRLLTRLSHWITVVCLVILVGSGLQIFNAHPALYWGDRSDRDRPLLALTARPTESGDLRGVTEILGHSVDTTGVLGVSTVDGEPVARGFPAWATLPSTQWLAMGRRWHIFFAWVFVLNGLVFALWAVLGRVRRATVRAHGALRGYLRIPRLHGHAPLHGRRDRRAEQCARHRDRLVPGDRRRRRG
jgi:hypothetical protein